MKTLLTFLFAFVLQQAATGQEFSFNLYLEDAAGYKDTLVMGYDSNASDTLDPLFGEVNIISIPFGSGFEARISDFDFDQGAQYITDPTTFHTKKLIKKKDCNSTDFPLVSAINLSKATYPVKVYWNSELFTDTCLEKSLIVDWHPGGWFDAVHGYEQGPFYLNAHDTVIFTHTTHHYITSGNDTIDMLFFTLASESNFISSTSELFSPVTLHVFPNPAKDYVQFEIAGATPQAPFKEGEPVRIIIMDVYGKQVARKEITSEQTVLDVRLLPNGVYFYRATLEGIFYSGKLVIQK